MEIEVNGEKRRADDMTIQEYLCSLSIDARRVAVELNLTILAKAEFATTRLSEGDRIEIVHFVGGGQGGSASWLKEQTSW
jgi:thiamine biosynthesis protein ThiS